MRIGKKRGSYLPILSTLVSKTQGDILELGVGFCSTPYLHWICYPTKRRLVSYENNPEYFKFTMSWEDDFHEIHCIDDWDKADIDYPWTIAFVDHSPGERRGEEMKRLTNSDFVIVHDSEGRNDRRYRLSIARHLYKYEYEYIGAYPHTSVFSNKYDPKLILTL